MFSADNILLSYLFGQHGMDYGKDQYGASVRGGTMLLILFCVVSSVLQASADLAISEGPCVEVMSRGGSVLPQDMERGVQETDDEECEEKERALPWGLRDVPDQLAEDCYFPDNVGVLCFDKSGQKFGAFFNCSRLNLKPNACFCAEFADEQPAPVALQTEIGRGVVMQYLHHHLSIIDENGECSIVATTPIDAQKKRFSSTVFDGFLQCLLSFWPQQDERKRSRPALFEIKQAGLFTGLQKSHIENVVRANIAWSIVNEGEVPSQLFDVKCSHKIFIFLQGSDYVVFGDPVSCDISKVKALTRKTSRSS